MTGILIIVAGFALIFIAIGGVAARRHHPPGWDQRTSYHQRQRALDNVRRRCQPPEEP